LAKLARAAGLQSPAYVFHIENGSKTPSEPVARRLAIALALDPELLAAWARARGRADLGSVLRASETVRRWLGESVDRLTAGPTPGEQHAAGTVAATGGDTHAVPVLPEGTDPTDGPLAPRAIETVHLARALLPPLGAEPELVAYRLSAHGARRLPDLLHPGDCVIVQLGTEPPGPDTPCAVRLAGRIELTRVRVDEDRAAFVGRVVLAFRRWL